MVFEPHDLPVESTAEPVVTASLTEVESPEIELSPESVENPTPPSSEEVEAHVCAAPVEVDEALPVEPQTEFVTEAALSESEAQVPNEPALHEPETHESAFEASELDEPEFDESEPQSDVGAASPEPEHEVALSEREPWVPPADYVPSPFAIPRDQHSVSRKHISKNALSVLYRLHESGFRALLVGGGVRDVLLGRAPKDFDIATDATPEQVRRLFRNCRLIGRRFRLAHVLFGRDVVEVATFRASGEDEPGRQADESGRLLRDNVYGTIEDDVQRRDFTVNALYYDIADFSVLDHVGGMQDLRDGVLRLLGDPETRYREDPVRMLRAARFAAKLGFKLHPDTEQPIAELSSLLAGVPPARLIDECVKLFHTGHGAASLHELVRLDLLRWLLPPLHAAMSQVEDDGAAWAFLYAALSNTDRRVAEGLPLSTAFLFAALLWPVVVMQAQAHAHAGQPEAMLLQQAGDEVLQQIQPHVAIPRHLQLLIREIWEMQVRFVVHQGRGVASLHGHPRFRSAYDFLLLRAQVGEPQALDDAAWWQAFVESGADDTLVFGAGEKGRSKRRRSSRRRKSSDAIDAVVVGEADEALDEAASDVEDVEDAASEVSEVSEPAAAEPQDTLQPAVAPSEAASELIDEAADQQQGSAEFVSEPQVDVLMDKPADEPVATPMSAPSDAENVSAQVVDGDVQAMAPLTENEHAPAAVASQPPTV
ncbi:MAG TPA: polynucleotide adenylyltransferase PcnB [bacterium]|nr:polynucleotide adenylyltransferase PcnB [bacterium]